MSSIANLYDILGEKGLNSLVLAFGGLRFYVPKTPTPELIEILGSKIATEFCFIYQGDEIDLPLLTVQTKQKERLKLFEMLTQGKSTREIAKFFGRTERWVWQIKAKKKAPKNQIDIFDVNV